MKFITRTLEDKKLYVLGAFVSRTEQILFLTPNEMNALEDSEEFIRREITRLHIQFITE